MQIFNKFIEWLNVVKYHGTKYMIKLLDWAEEPMVNQDWRYVVKVQATRQGSYLLKGYGRRIGGDNICAMFSKIT